MRPSSTAVLAIVCAFIGAVAALGFARLAGVFEDPPASIVVRSSDVALGDAEGASRPVTGNGFDPAAIYRERADGVVTVFSDFEGQGATPESEAQGSGFVASADGYILTNSHVITTVGEAAPGEAVEAADKVYVQFKDGDRIEADVVGWDLFDDVGLLKVDPAAHDLSPLPLGDSREVVVGEPVAAIGSPFGRESSLSVGVVAATERSIDSLTSQYALVDAIQTDAPINPGNSGGPLLDAAGSVIGINAQIRSTSGTAEGVGFAVPINSAVRSMEQLKKDGKVRYAWVGITTQTITPTLAKEFDLNAERGALIQSVLDASPAEKAGLRAGDDEKEFEGIAITLGGDLIVAIDGKPVENAEAVVRDVSTRLPGEKVVFTVVRDGLPRDVEVTLGERPAQLPTEE